MKVPGSIRCVLLCLGASAVLAFATGCAGDNVHQPRPEAKPENLAFGGDLLSSIPLFPDFGPLVNADSLRIIWSNSSRTRATVELDEFSLYIDVVNLNITIGRMQINNVAFMWDDDGNAHSSARISHARLERITQKAHWQAHIQPMEMWIL